MGIDFLDCTFRVEKEFGIKSPRKRGDMWVAVLAGVERVPEDLTPGWAENLTAGDMLRATEKMIKAAGKEVPEDCWPRLQKCIAETVAISPEEVSLESKLVKDLGFT